MGMISYIVLLAMYEHLNSYNYKTAIR